jgi:tetratricopeptide (TPR) repeat protein
MSHTTPGKDDPTTLGIPTVEPPTVSASPGGALPPLAGGASRYRPLILHARGGLGEVFVAHDEELQREVALKSIKPDRAEDPDCQRRFLLEAAITGRLEHPGVVPVYGLVRGEDGRPCYAMRFVRGESLAQAIGRFHALRDPRGRRLMLQRLLRRFIDLCNAIAYAHSKGIIHRDVKPANVMLGEFGETLVVDWGLAKRLGAAEEPPAAPSAGGGQMTVEGGVMGTPSYMAPEQAAGQNHEVGRHSDVYALGATLYHLLTGRPPFDADEDVVGLLERVARGDFPRPRQVRRDVPAALEAVCLKAMAAVPAARYLSAQEVAADVERYLADQAVGAWREPWAARLRRWTGRHRMFVTAAASALLVAVITLGVATALLLAANRRASDARADAVTNEAAADEARGQAERERDTTRHSLEVSLSEIDRFSRRIVTDPRLRERDLEQTQLALLKSAIASCRALLQGREDDPALHGRLARLEALLGGLHWQMGEQKQARQQYRTALDRLDRLCRDHPGERDLALERGKTYSDLGVSLFEDGQLESALEAFKTAREIQESLIARPDATDDDRAALARTQLNQGNVWREQKRYPEARAAAEAALKAYEALSKSHPENESHAESLGQSRVNRGAILHATGQDAEAFAETQRAVDLFRGLVKRDPTWPSYRFHLGVALSNLAGLQSDRQKKKKRYVEARDLLDDLARRSPGMKNYQTRLADVCHTLSNRQIEDGELDEGRQSLEVMRQATARLLARDPTNVEARALDAEALLGLGDNHRFAGRHPESESAFLQSIVRFRKLVDENPGSWHYKHRLGWAHNSLGILYRHMREPEKSVAQHRSALALRRQLAEHDPKSREYRANLASSYTNLANHSPGPVKAAEAEDLFKKAIAIQEKLVKEPIHTTQDVLDYAMSYNNLGILYQTEARQDEAERAWLTALQIREGLLKAKPGLVKVWNNLAMSYANVAANCIARKDRKGAVANLQKAVNAAEKAVKLQPDVEDHVTGLAKTLNDLADLLVGQKEFEPALERYERALAVLAPWEEKGVENLTPSMWRQVIDAHSGKAEVLSELRRYKEALRHHNRALEAAPSRERNRLLYQRALTLARSGQHRAAVDDVLDLLPRATSPKMKFPLAGLYCMAARAAGRDQNLRAEQRKDVADLYARRAVDLLRDCHADGLFAEQPYRKGLVESEALSLLRDREDFKKLLAKVEAKDEPNESDD